MKIGSKGRYAVAALVDVAAHGADNAVSLAEVSQRQDISLSYLEQLFAMLRRAGLVISSRGPGGGYRLARPADQTTIRSIFEAVDEGAGQSGESPVGDGRAEPLWQALGQRIEAYLDSVTVADVLAGRVGSANLSRAAE